VNIIIEEEFIPKKKHTIIKNNEEKSEFVEDFIRRFRNFDIVDITDKVLQIQNLRVGFKKMNLVLGLTQENSIENSLQDCLPFILKAHSPCYILLAYFK